MKKIASLFLILLLVLCLFLVLPINVSAASIETQDGFEVTITTDKTEYTANEDIQVKVNIKNNNTYKAEDISIETLLPEGLVLKNGNLTATDIDIEAGASYSASVVANLSDELKNNEETKPDYATKPQETTKQVNTTKPSNLQDTNVLKTGNEFNTVLWIVLLVVAAACIFLAVKYKKTTQMMSLFLCLRSS